MYLDRIIAFKFVKLIENENSRNNQELRLHAINLLLISLSVKQLVPPFDKFPTTDTTFSSYNWSDYQPKSIIDEIRRREIDKQTSQPPLITVDISGDRREIVAYQEIPSFGAHFYYAFSPTDPIEKWKTKSRSSVSN